MSSEWPKWLYRKNPKNGTKEGAVFDSMPANGGWMTRDEWNAKTRGEPRAVEQQAEPEPDKSEGQQLSDDLESLERHELIAVAEGAGVTIDRRWGNARIIEAIKEKAGI